MNLQLIICKHHHGIHYTAGVTAPTHLLSEEMSKCQLPSSCGNYGVFSQEDQQRKCPNNGTHHIRSESKANGSGCELSERPSCANVNGSWQMFFLARMEYYRNRFVVSINIPNFVDVQGVVLPAPLGWVPKGHPSRVARFSESRRSWGVALWHPSERRNIQFNSESQLLSVYGDSYDRWSLQSCPSNHKGRGIIDLTFS